MMIVCQYQLGDEVVEADKIKIMEDYYEKEHEIERDYKGDFEAEREKVQEFNRTRMETAMTEAGRRNCMISIWQNGDQYFCQLSVNALFYDIDIEKLQNILLNKILIEN
jgi:hypothetical protein